MNNQNPLFLFFKKYGNIFSFLVIFLFSLTLLRSAFYGILTPDETFYLTIPYRIICGDALLVDEWHASQFSAFLLYLPMKIFLTLTKSTDGMVLYFRCLFVFCQSLISVFTFHKMKKYGTLQALVSAVIFLLYVPETVNMLDYYTMSLMGFQVVALTLFCSENLTTPKLIFSGIVFACAVVAQPFNCLIYFIYSVAVIILFFSKKKKKPSDFIIKYLSLKSWFHITVGIIFVAVLFFIFLFSQITFSEFLANFGNIFCGENHTLPFSESGKTDMFSFAVIFKTLSRIAPLGIYIFFLLIFALLWDKNRLKNRNLWIFSSFIAVLILVIENIVSVSQELTATLFRPYIMFVFTFVCLMLTKNKDMNLFLIWWTGIIYTVFLGIISQALDYVGVIGLVISNTAMAPSLSGLIKEFPKVKSTNDSSKNSKPLIYKVICCISAIIILFDITSGTAIKFIDDTAAFSTYRQILVADTQLDKGPLKGIRTDTDSAEVYNNILSDIEEIKSNSCEKFLSAGLIPWTYFCFDEPPATFTTWYIEEEFGLFEEYYKNQEKIPQCIYVLKSNFYWGYDYTEISESHREFFSQMFDVTLAEGKAGYILYVNNMK